MKRRIFIEKSGKAAILASMGLSIVSCSEDDPQPDLTEALEIDLNTSPFDELTASGSWVLHPDQNIILVNVEGEIRAFTSVCTHSQCTRNWVFGSTEATCTCHGSKFGQQGEVIQGPASRSLQQFEVDQDGNVITIS